MMTAIHFFSTGGLSDHVWCILPPPQHCPTPTIQIQETETKSPESSSCGTLILSPTPTIQIQETEPRSPESSRCGRQNQGVPSRFPPHQQSRSRRQNPGVLNPRGVGAGIGGYWVGFIHHSASQGSLNNMFCHHASPPRCHI